MDHDRCREICKELFEYSSITRRQQGAQLLTGVRNGGVEAAEGMVSARMRLLYDYRAPAGTRWSPTMEQLRELQALFHVGGLRTPTTTQISRITARLRVHGRIEGRNVFYWFQNQKARERKRRLQMVAQDEASSPGGNGKTETAKQTIQQPKRSRQAGKQLATRLATEETHRSTLHLWRSRHQAEFPFAMKLAVAQAEEASGLVLQNFHEAEGICASQRRSINFYSLSTFPAAENEQSEVNNAPNAQHSAVPAMSAHFIISSTPMSATTHIDPATNAVIQQVTPITMGRAARDSASTVEIVRSPAYHNSLSRDTDCSTCSRGQFPLVLFPLSPQQQGNPPDPPSSSRCSNHNQPQRRLPLVKGGSTGRGELSPAQPSGTTSTLLDLKLAIDH